MLTMETYLGSVGVGVTSPQIFVSHGKTYVVKLQNNRLGKKVLVNEYLASCLGEMLGVCFPQGSIITIPREVIEKSHCLKNHHVQEGPHFGCIYLKNSIYLKKWHICRAINTETMAGVILFDHMFHNIDRTKNRKNLLFQRQGRYGKIYAIDNSHLFRIGAWDNKVLHNLQAKISINLRSVYGVLVKHYLAWTDFTTYIDKIEAITTSDILQMIETIPEVWLPDAQERTALLEYIQARRVLAREIAQTICSLVPNVYRRTHTN